MKTPLKNDHKRTIRSFVRREGRMTKGQCQALEQFWPIYGVEATVKPLDVDKLFPKPGKCILEIGFGMGHSLVQMAAANTQKNYLGIEVFRTGIATLLSALSEQNLHNVCVMEGDAKEILSHCIADGALAGVQIFFPDPWPKKKHHKRRLIQSMFVEVVAKKLQIDGYLHISTDWEDYAQHISDIMRQATDLVPVEEESQVLSYLKERPLTKYEQRGKRLGHQIWDFVFIKI